MGLKLCNPLAGTLKSVFGSFYCKSIKYKESTPSKTIVLPAEFCMRGRDNSFICRQQGRKNKNNWFFLIFVGGLAASETLKQISVSGYSDDGDHF